MKKEYYKQPRIKLSNQKSWLAKIKTAAVLAIRWTAPISTVINNSPITPYEAGKPKFPYIATGLPVSDEEVIVIDDRPFQIFNLLSSAVLN